MQLLPVKKKRELGERVEGGRCAACWLSASGAWLKRREYNVLDCSKQMYVHASGSTDI